MATWAEKLASALSSTPKPATLGTGAASNAAQAINGRAYQMHVQEAQALGQQPLTPQQFAAQQQ